MLAAVCLFLLTACGGVAKQTIKHQLNSGGMNITMEIPKDGFRSFEMYKTDAANSDFKLYKRNFADDFSTVVIGPKYSVIITQIAVDNDYLKMFKLKDITVSGNKGFLFMREFHTSEKFPVIHVPYEPTNTKTGRASGIEIKLVTNEAVALERKIQSFQENKDPALKKAAEESAKLLENKEVLDMLNSIKIEMPKG